MHLAETYKLPSIKIIVYLKKFMHAYILKTEHTHLTDMTYDMTLLPFTRSDNLKYQLLSTNHFNVPIPVKFLGNFNIVKSETDYPVVDDNLVVMSNRMISILSSIKALNVKLISAIVLDDTYIVDNRFDDDGNLKPDIPMIEDFSLIQIMDVLKVFDFEKSDFTPLKSNPDFPGVVKKMVLREPSGGFPPIFRLFEQPTTVIVSEKAKEELIKHSIKGCIFEPVSVTPYKSI
jgi:hypothetical protein